MKKFSIADSIANYKKEFDFVDENWKGQAADSYKSYLSYMGNVLIAAEKCLEKINDGYAYVSQKIEESESFKTIGAKSMNSSGIEKHSNYKQIK